MKNLKKYQLLTTFSSTAAAVGNLENKHPLPERTAAANQYFCKRGIDASINSDLELRQLAAEPLRTRCNQFCVVETRGKKLAPTRTIRNVFYPVPTVNAKLVTFIFRLYG